MPTDTLLLDGNSLTVPSVVHAARTPACRVGVLPGALAALAASRSRGEGALASGQTIYGINTGFGKLANVRIAPADLECLQVNLIRSHAAGVGAPLPPDVVRGLMILRANVLLRPTSGVRPALVEALLGLLNAGLVPFVPEQGHRGEQVRVSVYDVGGRLVADLADGAYAAKVDTRSSGRRRTQPEPPFHQASTW